MFYRIKKNFNELNLTHFDFPSLSSSLTKRLSIWAIAELKEAKAVLTTPLGSLTLAERPEMVVRKNSIADFTTSGCSPIGQGLN